MLIDEDPTVREASSLAFGQLFKNVGSKAVERVVPSLLRLVHSDAVSDAVVEGGLLFDSQNMGNF